MGPGSQGWGCGLGGRSFQLRLSDRGRKDADASLPNPARVRAPQGLRAELGPRPGRPRGPRRSPPALPLQRRRRGPAEGRAGRQPQLSPPTSRQRELPRAALPPQPRFPAPASQRASGRGSAGAGPLPPRHRGVLGRAPAAMAEAERG